MKKDFLWLFFSNFGATLLMAIAFFIYAGILTPAQYGMAISILAVTQIIAVVITTLFDAPMVQKLKITDSDFNNVMTAGLLLATIASIVSYFGILKLYGYEGNNQARIMILLAISEVFFNVMATPYIALLKREGRFEFVGKASLTGRIAGLITGLVSVFSGGGSYSIILQNVVAMAVQAAMLIYKEKKLPRYELDFHMLKHYLSFGSLVTIRRTAYEVFARLITVAAKLVAGEHGAGVVGFAMRLVQIIHDTVSGTIQTYFLPTFSRAQSSIHKTVPLYRNTTCACILMTSPLFLGLFATAKVIVLTIFGDRWLEAVPFIRIFCVSSMFSISVVLAYQVFVALGKPQKFTLLYILAMLTSSVFMFTGSHFDLINIGYAHLMFQMSAASMFIVGIKQELGISIRSHWWQLRYMVPALIMAAAELCYLSLYPVTSGSFLLLGAMVLAGALIYVVSATLIFGHNVKAWILQFKENKAPHA